MMRKHFVLLNLFFLILVACNNSYEVIEKTKAVVNQYDSSKPTMLESINPTYGVIDETFIVNGNFPGDIANIKVYFGTKRAVIIANNGISITGLVPKQLDGYNQVSMVIGKDSIVPANLKFKYKQSRSVKTIAGKLGTELWMPDASYSGAAIDAVTFGEVHYVATVSGQKNDNILVLETGWGNRLFMLSLDDNKIQKLSTPTNITSMAVPSTRDRFYATSFHQGDHPIYMYSKEISWAFVNTGIIISKLDFPGVRVPSMTFAEDDNLLYVLDVEGRIAEVNLAEKSYKIYTTADKKPSSVAASNFGGLIKGLILPSNFGDWEDSYITYSKYHKCFFVSYTYEQAIYQYIKNANNTWTCNLYAGKNGQGSTVGDRLLDAQFNKPSGLVVNADGDIIVCNKGNQPWDGQGHCISKISKNAVEVLAGKTNSNNPLLNGLPLESTFNTPRNISIDFEGNYYIAGGNDYTVRKLSIE